MSDAAETYVSILSEAFADDPVLNWIADKPGFVQMMFEMIVPVYLERGIYYRSVADDGAALWTAPGITADFPVNPRNIVRFVTRAGLGSLLRLSKMDKTIQRVHPSEPHYYLFAIGVGPAAGQTGVGSQLMARMLEQCDAERTPAYLENSRAQNLAFYEKHGFEVMREIQFDETAPVVWQMWRKPQTSQV